MQLANQSANQNDFADNGQTIYILKSSNNINKYIDDIFGVLTNVFIY